MVNIELRMETRNRIETFAKLLISGANVNYTLIDIEKDIYHKYLEELKYRSIPVTQKRKIARELTKLDVYGTINDIQKGQ